MNITGIELRHLRYFLAVAEELNFSRAAERLHMAQPPLSQQIQEMEARLETPLFTRSKRKVELTPAGATLIPYARKMLREVEDALWATHAAGRGQTRALRVGTIFSAPLVPAFGKTIKKFQKSSPETRLSVQEMRHAQALKALNDKSIDMAFVWQIEPPKNKSYGCHIVSSDRLRLYMPEDHKLAHKKQISISDLTGESLLLTTLQLKMPFFGDLQLLARQESVALRVLEEASHFTVIANLVAANIGLGILPEYVAHLANQPLVHKTIKGLPLQNMHMDLAILYRLDNESDVLAEFLETAGSTGRH